MDDSGKLQKVNDKEMKDDNSEDDVDVESEENDSDVDDENENGDTDSYEPRDDGGKPRKKRKTKENENDSASSSSSSSTMSNSASSDAGLLMPKLDPFAQLQQPQQPPAGHQVSGAANSPGFYPYSGNAHPHALLSAMVMPAVIPSLDSNVTPAAAVATAGIPLAVAPPHQPTSHSHHHHHPPGTISISSAISNAAKDEPRALSTLEQLAQAEKLGIDLGDDDEEEENVAGNGAPKRSHKGTSCHQCKNTKSLKKLAFCANLFNKRTKPEKRICRKVHSTYRMSRIFGPRKVRAPHSNSICLCAFCVV
jgi:hypothetical protein